MKKNTAIILLATLAFFSACKKNTSTPSPTGSTNSFSATIEGSNWKPGFTYAADSANTIFIIGNVGNNSSAYYPELLIGIPDTLSSGATVHFNISENVVLLYA